MNTGTCDLSLVAQACAASDPARGGEELRAGLGRVLPGLSFSTVMTRGGWYRSGGVVDLDKRRVATSLRVWAEQDAGGNVAQLLERCLQQPLFATRLTGRTHYLTAATGPAAADFVQLEVEELQEVLDRYLSDPDWLPDSVEEFIDPLDYPQVEAEPVGAPRLVFRRMFSAAELVGQLPREPADSLARFLRDWEGSSAAQSGRFCERWVLGVPPSGDSDGDTPARARPLPASGTQRLPANPEIRGAALANLIQAYDRQAGYPMAWYFNMLASAGVADGIGRQVADDHQDGSFSYLPARDLELLRNWVVAPYRA